jgi:hypothetical protein
MFKNEILGTYRIGKSWIQISARRVAVLTDVFLVFLQINAGIVPEIRPRKLPPTSFPIHHSPIFSSDAVLSELLRKHR